MDTNGDAVDYYIEDENIPLSVLLLSPHMKLLRKSDHPFRYSIWSLNCDVKKETIELMEKQIENFHSLFGDPVGKPGMLSICVINVNKNVLGAMMGDFIAINALYLNSALSSIYGGSTTISHELMHYWWINRIYAPLTENDITFHECFIDHLLDFYSNHVRKTSGSRTIELISRFLTRRSSRNFLSMARGGFSFAVLPDSTRRFAPFLESSSKGIAILNSLSNLYGGEEWEKRILSYFNLIKNGGAISFENFCAVNGDIEPYIRSFFEEDRDFDYAVKSVRNERLLSGMIKTEVRLENRGGIFAPAPVRITFDDGTSTTDTLAIEDGEKAILKLSNSGVKRVSVDPDRLLPDIHPGDNDYPDRINLSFLSRSLNGNGKRSTYSIDILPLYMMPFYSEDIGLELFAMPIRCGDEERNFGVIGSKVKSGFSLSLGYNFKAEEPVWNFDLGTPLSIPARACSAGFRFNKSPATRAAVFSLSGGYAKNPFYHPAHSYSLRLAYYELLRPSFREEAWPTGKELMIEAQYGYMNINTLFYPFSGYSFLVRGDKAIGTDWTDWNYERLLAQIELYRTLPAPSVLSIRLHGGHIFGFAPLQEQFGLDRNALMGTFDLYEKTGQSIVSADLELRLKEKLPLMMPVFFFRNSWLKAYGSMEFKSYREAGMSLRFWDNFPLSLSVDFTLWRKVEEKPGENFFAVQIRMGRPFDYSPIRMRL